MGLGHPVEPCLGSSPLPVQAPFSIMSDSVAAATSKDVSGRPALPAA